MLSRQLWGIERRRYRHRDSEAQRTAKSLFFCDNENDAREGRETEKDKDSYFVVLCFSVFSGAVTKKRFCRLPFSEPLSLCVEPQNADNTTHTQSASPWPASGSTGIVTENTLPLSDVVT
jgi:hypothetical protein